jgi:hypothetical protein
MAYTEGYKENPFDTVNRTIGGGTCKLIARRENNTHQMYKMVANCLSPQCSGYGCWPPGTTDFCIIPYNVTYKFSSGALTTKKSFKYGYFEMRFRFPSWSVSTNFRYMPAYWLFNGNSQTQWSEIDIFEIKADSGFVTNTIHVDATVDSNFGPPSSSSYPSDPYDPGGYSINLSQWHTMSCWWRPDSISFFMDNNFIRSSKRDTNQYLIEMPVIIQNQINNYFRSFYSGECGYMALDTASSTLPFTMEIDYVKTWQPKLACDTNKVYCNVTQANFNSKIYKSLTIGGSGCSATFNNGKASAEGNDYVLLQDGFEVGSNMEMLIQTESCWNQMKLQNTIINTSSPPTPYFNRNKIGRPAD